MHREDSPKKVRLADIGRVCKEPFFAHAVSSCNPGSSEVEWALIRRNVRFAEMRRVTWRYGEVSEWLIEPVSKTGVPLAGTAGSNPALSVNF